MRANELKFAFIADDIRNLNEFGIFHNTTFGLMLTACEIDAKVFLTESNNLKIINNKVIAKFDEVSLKQTVGNHIYIKDSKEHSLDSMNIIFARKDPPIDSSFISYMHMLSFVPHITTSNDPNKKTLIVNNPEGILGSNEKLYVFNLPQYLPTTLITSNKEEIISFLKTHKEAVIKPIFNKGGDGVFYLNVNDLNINPIIELSLTTYKTIIIQKYLPEIISGDKRIILLNGEPIGGIVRVPKEGEFRAHISRGASFKPLTLSKRDIEICESLKPLLIKDGLYFAAIDIIGDYLIEVNFTCPANLLETGEANKKPLAKQIINWAIEEATTNQPVKVS